MRAITTLVLTLTIITPLAAQETKKATNQTTGIQEVQLPLVSQDSLRLVSFTPERVSARQLAENAKRMWGREFLVGATRETARTVTNILYIGDAVIVYDTEEMSRSIMTGLQQMESASGKRAAPPKVGILEYAPKHVSAHVLERALRSLVDRRGFTGNTGTGIKSVDSVNEVNRVIVRGTEGGLAAARSLITKVDVPEPQVMLSCWIIQGSAAGKDDAQIPLPTNLVRDLQRLVPFKHFNSLGMGLVRTAVQSGTEIQLQIELGAFGSASLELAPGMFLEKEGTLQLAQVRFSISNTQKNRRSSQQFTTRASVRYGEYTVLGALGSQPVFVVLRMTPGQ